MTAFPSLSPAGERRQARLRDARLQVVVGARAGTEQLEGLLVAVTSASVDVCRLRDDRASEDELRAAADVFRRVCERAGALFVLDRLPGLALQVGADGVHVSAPDVEADHARRIVGPDLLVGRTARHAEDVSASAEEDVDYLEVTGAGVAVAVRSSPHPWFAVVPADGQAEPLLRAGAGRLVLDGGMLSAEDPAQACWQLRRAVSANPL